MSRMKRDEQGMTVAELAVVLLILSLVTLSILGFLDQVTSVTAQTTGNTQAEVEGQGALRTISQDLRAANPVTGTCGPGYATCISFEVPRPGPSAAITTCKSAITYRLANNVVHRTRTDTGDCATDRSRTEHALITVHGSQTTLFQYFDRLGKPISPTQTCPVNPTDPPCPLGTKSIKVNLVLDFPGQRNGLLRLATTAALRNTR